MCNNIPIIGVPEGEEREKGAEHVFEETMPKKICGLGKEMDIQVHEPQSPKQEDLKEIYTKTHIIIMAKIL